MLVHNVALYYFMMNYSNEITNALKVTNIFPLNSQKEICSLKKKQLQTSNKWFLPVGIRISILDKVAKPLPHEKYPFVT